MRRWVSGIAAAILLVASPARAQESRPLAVEAGVVMGIFGVRYPTVAVVAAPWSVRASGVLVPGVVHCYGLQVNVGRVLREVGNAKHTVGAVWAGFRSACGSENAYRPASSPEFGGQYFGAASTSRSRDFSSKPARHLESGILYCRCSAAAFSITCTGRSAMCTDSERNIRTTMTEGKKRALVNW